MKNLRRISSFLLVGIMVLTSLTSFAAPRDVYKAEDLTLFKKAGEMAVSKKTQGQVAVSPSQYAFEGLDGKIYSFADADKAFKEKGADAFLEELKENYTAINEEKTELKVIEISAIDEYGVTVKFEATTEDNDEANVVVKDGEGNVIETEARLIAEGETTATFDFVTPFEANYEFTGVWTVNGVKYSFDAINQLKDIIDAAADGNQITFQAALDAAGITYEDELKIGDYLTAVHEADLDEYTNTLADVQEIIDEIDGTAADKAADAAKVKAVADAKTQAQLLSALQDNFDAVNPAWIVGYFNSEGVNIDDAEDIKASDIQDAIYAVNADAIDDAKAEVETAADQAAVTALIEAWMKPDAEGETAKETAIKDSKLAEAAYKVKEATTANRLYDALVAFANLADDEDIIDIEDIKSENKSFYFAVERELEEDQTIVDLPAAIVEAGNEAAENAQEAIDGRVAYDYTMSHTSESVIGYGVNFNVNFGDNEAEEFVVELYNGDNLLARATGTEKLIKLVNGKEDGEPVTAPFDIFGTFDYEDDGFWAYSGWNGDAFETPTKVKALVVFSDATAKVEEPVTVVNQENVVNDIASHLVGLIVKSKDVAEVQELLIKLTNAKQLNNFINTPKADRTFVAETILEEEAATKKAWTVDTLDTYIETLNTDTIEAAKTAVNKLNNTSNEDAVITALSSVKVFEDLTPIAKKDVANAFIEEVLEGLEEGATPNFKSYTELSNFVEGLIK